MPITSIVPLLEVRDLRVEFRTGQRIVNAVNGVGFHVSRGETLAVLGESGSGKSVSFEAVMGVLESPPVLSPVAPPCSRAKTCSACRSANAGPCAAAA